MKINVYTDNEKYNMHTKEYQIVWELEGQRIYDAFEKIITLPKKRLWHTSFCHSLFFVQTMRLTAIYEPKTYP